MAIKLVETKSPVSLKLEERDPQTAEIIAIVELIIIDDIFGKGPCAYLHHVYTDKTHEKRGIATRLVKRARDIAQNNSCYKIFVICEPELKNFYERAGFKDGRISMQIRWDNK
jgi:GNAT superfamily N-acetyltransferase